MRFWLREVAGWLLTAVGLWACFQSYYEFLKNGLIFEGGGLAVIGIFIFRGGIGLLRTALAARVCSEEVRNQKSEVRSLTRNSSRGG
jgi:hypothetical protein